MPIKPRWLTPRTEIRIMPLYLVISVVRPSPYTRLALARIVLRISCSPIILTFSYWLNGKKVANMMSCRRDMSAIQLHGSLYSTVKR